MASPNTATAATATATGATTATLAATPEVAAAASWPHCNAHGQPLPAWSAVPYLLQQYCHDDPKKLNDFRLNELDALAQLVGAPRCYTRAEVLYSSPFLRARFPSEQHMRRMAERSMLVSRWNELWADGATLDECLADLARRKTESRVDAFVTRADLTYDVRVHTFGLTPAPADLAAQREAVIAAMGLKGTLHSGSNVVAQRFFLFVDVGSNVVNPSRVPRHFYLAREICDEKANTLENDYRLNARTFIGPTSMPANLSFIMANLGLVQRNSVVYDPFVGTGSLLVSAGHFGAHCIGSDLDWKILHGRTRKGPISVRDNFKQYKLRQPELLCCDLSVNQWTRGAHGLGFIDAIVCDPPYGVRAGARKSGRAEGKEVRTVDPALVQSGAHVPTTQLYDVEDVIHDLLDQSAQILKLGGRLIYWLPTTTDFRNEELPAHPCLRQISVSEQVVRSHFSRRLIAMEKWQPFTDERRMHRRDKTKDPPPKYANLKETIAALTEEGPDRYQLGTATPAAPNAAAAAASTENGATDANAGDAAASYDPTSQFAPRAVSRAAQKRLAKMAHIAARKQHEAAENGGVRPSRRERIAKKERMPAEQWREAQKQRNLAVHEARQQAHQGQEGQTPTSTTSNMSKKRDNAAASNDDQAAQQEVASAESTNADAATPASAAPASPTITQAAKKARVGEE